MNKLAFTSKALCQDGLLMIDTRYMYLVEEAAQHVSDSLGALKITNHDQILLCHAIRSPALDI